MDIVVQEELTGCGLAAVANIVGASYREVQSVANAMGIFAQDERLFSDTGYVRRLLEYFGYCCSDTETAFSDWRTLPDLALMAIKYRLVDGAPFWHWVVFKRTAGEAVVLDSAAYLERNLRTDFAAIKPQWFIAVTPA